MEAVKNPWKELWKQLDKEEKKALIIETAKERYILTTLTTVFTLLMFSPYIIFLPFVYFFCCCAFFQFGKTLNKNLLLQYPALLDKLEIEAWDKHLEKQRQESDLSWLGKSEDRRNDPFYDTTAVNRVGTLAYSRRN